MTGGWKANPWQVEPPKATAIQVHYEPTKAGDPDSPFVDTYDGIVILAGVEVWREPVRIDSRYGDPSSLQGLRDRVDYIVMSGFAKRLAEVMKADNPDGGSPWRT